MGSKRLAERALVALITVMMVTGALPATMILALDGGGAGDGPPQPQGWSGDGAGHQWPMFARDASHGGLADAYARGISSPGVKWERVVATQGLGTVIGNFSANVRSSNASRPFDGQLHCAVYSTPNQVHLVKADGANAWQLNLTGQFVTAPAVGDVDGDGRTDVVIATRAGALYAYEPVIRWNGTRYTWWGNNTAREQVWNTTGSVFGTITSSSLVLDDLNGNGTDELLVGTAQGVLCLNARYGNELWNRTVSGVSISTPAVYRLGAQRNVVATSWNTTPTPDRLHVYTLRGTTGALIKRVTMELTVDAGTFLPVPSFFPSPVAADLDGQGDGDELIIVHPYDSSTGRVIAFEDGDLSWGAVAYNRSLGGSAALDHICHATPAVGDLDGDGDLDVVVASWRTYRVPVSVNTYTNISVFEGINGARRWAVDIDRAIAVEAEWAMSSPVLIDVDKDDHLDVVVVQYNGRMNAISGRNGTVLWDITTRGFPAALVSTSPAVGDLDVDGFPEVVVNSQAVSFLLPDLEVTTEDITLTDPHPDEGESVGIDVLVHNRGNTDAEDVLVSVWDGDALAGNATIDSILADSSYSARVTYEFYGRVEHTLRAVVDPLGDIEELREDNNDATKDVTIVSRYGVAIDCPNNETIINPGTTWHFFCEVTNVGQYANRVRVTTTPAPAGWTVRADPASMLLGPAGTAGASTTVDVEVRTDPTAQAGEYPLLLTVTSQNQTRNNDSVTLTTVIRGTHGVHLAPSEDRGSVAPGDAVVYRFNATNIGNSVDSFSVTPVTVGGGTGWGVNVFPDQINGLAPDGHKEIRLSVSAPYEATEGEGLTILLQVASISEPARYDESRVVTSVVIPDIAVLGIRYLRADGSQVDGDSKRLVTGEESTVVGRVTNVRRNTDISNLRVRFVVDGIPHDVNVQDIPASEVVEVGYAHTFTTTGVHSIQVVADPFEVIADGDRSNNQASGSVRLKDRTPVGAFDIGGTVYLSDGETPVAGATVRVEVAATSYSFTVSADDLGVYTASLGDSRYSDGDLLVVNGTDGKDFAEATLLAYSEDGGATVNLVLSEGVHYDVELLVASPQVQVDTGEEVRLNVTLRSVGTRAATVDLSAQAQDWGPRLLMEDGTPATYVELPLGGSVGLVLAFDVPDDAEGGSTMVLWLMAVPRQDPGAAGTVNVTANVTVVRAFGLQVTGSPAGPAHPEDTRVHNLTVTSMGNVDDIIDLTFDQRYVTWELAFDVDPVTVRAFGQVVVRVTLKVPRTTDAGEYVIAVSGTSQADDSVVANAYITEDVQSKAYGVSVVPTSTSASGRPGTTARWQLEVINLGNVADRYTLQVFSLGAEYAARFLLDAAPVVQLDLQPGRSKGILLEVDVPESFTEKPVATVPFTVKATSSADAATFNNSRLTLVQEGILDLTISDVVKSTGTPRLGKRVRLTVSVFNDGPDDATGVTVYAYLGEEPIKKVVGNVAAKETQETIIEWFPAKEGSVQVRIVVNPESEQGSIWEYDFDNNEYVWPTKVEKSEEASIFTSLWFWVIVAVIAVGVIVALAMFQGGGGDEEPIEVAEVVEGPDEGGSSDAGEEQGDEGERGEEARPAPPPPRKAKAKAKPKGRPRPPPEEPEGMDDEDMGMLLIGGKM